MKLIKYMIALIAIAVALLLSGEIYINYAMKFDGYGSVLVENDKEDKTAENDMAGFQEYFDVMYEEGFEGIFCAYTESGQKEITEINIYADEVAKKHLLEDGRQECAIKSIFGGGVKVRYHDLSQFLKRSSIPEFRIYGFGSKEAIKKFNQKKIEKEKDKQTQLFENGAENALTYSVLKGLISLLWIVIFVFLLFLTVCDCHFERKKEFVKISCGYPLGKMYRRNLILDYSMMLLFFGGEHIVLRKYCVIRPFLISILMAFLAYMVFVAVIYASILSAEYKKMLMRSKGSAFVMGFSYVIKTITVLIAVSSITTGYIEVKEYLPQIKKESFLRQYQDYVQVRLHAEKNYCSEVLGDEFYCKYKNENDIKMWEHGITHIDGLSNIIINDSSLPEFRKLLPEYQNYEFKEDEIYVLTPENVNIEKINLKEELQGWDIAYLDAKDKKVNYLTYRKNINTYTLANEYDIGWCQNPMIIIDMRKNIPPYKFDVVYSSDGLDYDLRDFREIGSFPFKMMKVSEKKLQEQIKTIPGIASVEIYHTYQEYEKSMAGARMKFYLTMALCLMVILLDIIITVTILKLEFEVNGLEFAVTKVNGMPLMKRYAGLFWTSILTGIVAFAASEQLYHSIYDGYSGIVLLISAIFIVVEIIFMATEIARREMVNTQKILKGGCL